MLDLLNEFSAVQIFTFLILFVLAIKETWSLIDYFKSKYQEKFNKDYGDKKKEEELSVIFDKWAEQHKDYATVHENLENKLDELTAMIDSRFETIEERLEQLDNNDKHTIKQTLVKDYHFFTEQGWIDDFSLDTILLLYDDYKHLGGNSYVRSLIEKIKELPHRPAN